MSGVRTWLLRRRYTLVVVAIVMLPLVYWAAQGQAVRRAGVTLTRPLLGAPYSKPVRYLLGLNYWEQLTMATCNFAHLVCLGARWHADTVLPFTFNSRLYGLPNFKPDENLNASRLSQTLDFVYDVDNLGAVLARHGLPLPVRFDEFVAKALRQVVVLHFIPEKETHELPVMTGEKAEHISAAFRRSSVVDCSTVLKGFSKHISSALDELAYSLHFPRFTITQYYCVNMSQMTSPRQLADMIGLRQKDDVTVIVVNWRGTSDRKTVISSATGTHSNKRIAMKGMCNMSLANRGYFQHSALVQETAERFMSDSGLSQQGFIAVHYRSEKIAMRADRYPNAIALCFQEVDRIVKALLKKKRLGYSSVLYVLDSGPYSSDTCRSCRGAREMRALLEEAGLPIAHFDPLHYSLPADSGLAAAVEASVLSAAGYLVLCGGGGFQSQVALGFLEQRSKKQLVQLCHSDGNLKTLSSKQGGS